MATALPGKELAEALAAESRPRILSTPLEVCKELVAMARRDYTTALQGIADFVLTLAVSPQRSASH